MLIGLLYSSLNTQGSVVGSSVHNRLLVYNCADIEGYGTGTETRLEGRRLGSFAKNFSGDGALPISSS
jgi:hypothetical protein